MSNAPTGTTFSEQATRLVARVDQDRWGSVRPSLYETARVTSAAPWLHGETRRVEYLLDEQASDGSWGDGPEPYRLLPTLSAVEATLAVLRRATVSGDVRDRLTSAAGRGLAALRALPPQGPWPDTAAAELLVPSLISEVNEHLALAAEEIPGLAGVGTADRLAVPGGYHEGAPAYVAGRYKAAGALPVKLHHTFEGIAGHIPPALIPDIDGLLGSSPAATAAWAASRRTSAAVKEAVAHLEPVAHRYDGLFTEAAPIRVFERLWVAAALARAGLPAAGVPTVRTWVDEIYDPEGVRGAPGLMTDADDTAMAVLVASLVGRPYGPGPLDLFHNGSHFDCYIGEDTGSVTANAHALQALVSCSQHLPPADGIDDPRSDKLCDWLIGQQRTEGHWTDKWHASPYYSTERCVSALAQHGGHHATAAVAQAAAWTADTQRDDGSWGVWGGTAEETAYAVKILLSAAPPAPGPRQVRALVRAEAYLDAAVDARAQHPALWHDKTLYAPDAMIEAEILCAREMLRIRHL
ncbi:prenyltransferase/squalene oxidase repeat-containing protein [Streptomyces sp. NPDC060035]|uniref:prenyltransferase/squalene oxidase repeat-containing protein n=1 Tax=Streptomyces sp. NPDC060035 TaxID=3347044 RepID=UPI0036955552